MLLEKGIIILLAYLLSQMRITSSSQWMLALLEKTVTAVFDNCPLRRALTSGKIKIPEEKYLQVQQSKHLMFSMAKRPLLSPSTL
jgi:hypothetical protein